MVLLFIIMICKIYVNPYIIAQLQDRFNLSANVNDAYYAGLIKSIVQTASQSYLKINNAKLTAYKTGLLQ